MIVLDTQVFLWWASDEAGKLSKPAAALLAEAREREASVFVSAISAWEIGVLIQKGRLSLSMDVEEWLSHAAALPELRYLPIDRQTVVQSVRLPGELHVDPADRIVVATARRLNLPLVTADSKIRDYPHVKTIW